MSSPGASSSSSSGAGKNLPTPTAEVLESLPTHMLIQELTRRHRILGAPLKKAVIMGPPGSGKSSIADHFRYNFGYCSVLPNEADSQLSAGEKMQRIQVFSLTFYLTCSLTFYFDCRTAAHPLE